MYAYIVLYKVWLDIDDQTENPLEAVVWLYRWTKLPVQKSEKTKLYSIGWPAEAAINGCK